MDKENFLARLIALFDTHPGVDEFHITSDGTPFLSQHIAEGHAQRLSNKDVGVITRRDMDTYTGDLEDLAPEETDESEGINAALKADLKAFQTENAADATQNPGVIVPPSDILAGEGKADDTEGEDKADETETNDETEDKE
jgi:hypothetical protein